MVRGGILGAESSARNKKYSGKPLLLAGFRVRVPARPENASGRLNFSLFIMNVIDKIEREQVNADIPDFGPGDTVNVHSRVVEGGKERIQIFKGIVISRRGSAVNEACTVRKISNGEGVERSFQIHSPKVAKIEVVKRGNVRRAKLSYLRTRLGKAATNVREREDKPAEKEAKAQAKAEKKAAREKEAPKAEKTETVEKVEDEVEAAEEPATEES